MLRENVGLPAILDLTAFRGASTLERTRSPAPSNSMAEGAPKAIVRTRREPFTPSRTTEAPLFGHQPTTGSDRGTSTRLGQGDRGAAEAGTACCNGLQGPTTTIGAAGTTVGLPVARCLSRRRRDW